MEFLENLDTLHCALGRVYPIRPPLFRCEKQLNGTYNLHYYSKRQGLEYYVMGILRRTLDVLYNTKIELRLLEKNSGEDHSVFSIQFEAAIGYTLDTTDMSAILSSAQKLFKTEPFISPSTFAILCPFYIMFDRNLIVKGCGTSVLRALPKILSGYRKLSDVARLVRPSLPLTFESIAEHQNCAFLIDFADCSLAGGVKGHSIKLSGQMMYTSSNDSILFISSPYITSLEDLHARGFSLSDVPLHDAKREFILASENFALEHKIISQLEELTQRLQETTKRVREEKKKTDK